MGFQFSFPLCKKKSAANKCRHKKRSYQTEVGVGVGMCDGGGGGCGGVGGGT